eukprot:CAMPEP_0184648210 /NCGR_PEP_ID=MMETSP0308-20130426/5283_1 /TAXON_ID=38269 /ORGANISM="Gloeochaete witrockiana, Strain SAG 46.84" /LENGTH=36 /DNA_ID= /DNA_START= /DNA_END= /DNA_ORIENTATION=
MTFVERPMPTGINVFVSNNSDVDRSPYELTIYNLPK